MGGSVANSTLRVTSPPGLQPGCLLLYWELAHHQRRTLDSSLSCKKATANRTLDNSSVCDGRSNAVAAAVSKVSTSVELAPQLAPRSHHEGLHSLGGYPFSSFDSPR